MTNKFLFDPEGIQDMNNYIKRMEHVKLVSWSLPSDEAITRIKNFVGNDKVLEIGAGLGYWASLLKTEGVRIIATDAKEGDWKHNSSPPYMRILELDHKDAIREFPCDVLFVIWPPMSPMAAESLKLFKGNRFIYVGEGYGGCNANDSFFSILEKEWKKEKYVGIPQWWGIHDTLTFWKRRKD